MMELIVVDLISRWYPI